MAEVKQRSKRRWRRRAYVTLSVVLVPTFLYFLICLIIVHLSVQPNRMPRDSVTGFPAVEEVSFTTSDGIHLKGLYFPARGERAVVLDPVGLSTKGHRVL